VLQKCSSSSVSSVMDDEVAVLDVLVMELHVLESEV
jgi:hypothetical protein